MLNMKTDQDKVYLYGAGGHAKVVREMLELHGRSVAAYIDDITDIETLYGLPVLHDGKGLSPMIVAIGSNADRKRIAEMLDCDFATVIHPSAIVSPQAVIGEGSVVMPGAIVNAGARIGRHCIVNTGASVGHDCCLGDYCHVAPHSTLCGTVHLGEGVWIGAGAVVNQKVNVGDWTVVGSGSAVVSDIVSGVTAVGVPARSMTIIDRIVASMRLYGDSTAVMDGTESITYEQLRSRSNAIAHLLVRQGGHFAAVLLPRSCWFTVSIIGVIKAGMAYLPVSHDNPMEYNLSIIKEVSPSAIITTSELWKTYGSHFDKNVLPVLVDEMDWERSFDADIDYSDGSKAAALLYTSGTTGYRKGVLHSLGSLTFLCDNYYHAVCGSLPERPVGAMAVDLCFIAGLVDLFLPLMYGGVSYIVTDEVRKDIGLLSASMIENNVCDIVLIGSMAAMLAKSWKGGRLVVSSTGERFPSNVTDIPPVVDVYNFYGMSECGSCFCYRIKGGESTVPMGQPVAGARAFLLDPEGNPIADGETGELYVRSQGTAIGYYKNETLTKERFLDCPFEPGNRMFRTGDIVRVLPDGNWLYCGREDNIVKVRGFRLNTGDVENTALECSGVEWAVAVLQDMGRLALFYGGAASESSVRVWLASRLPEYMCPGRVIHMEHPPKGNRGKADGKTLQKMSSWSEMEIQLAAAFEKILDVPVTDLECDFFSSGGDSLAVMNLCYEMSRKGLDAKTVYRARSIRKIAEALSTKVKELKPKTNRIGIGAFQRRIVDSQLAFPDRAMWNNFLLFRLGKDCNRRRLLESLECAVRNHPMLAAKLCVDENGDFWLEHSEKIQGKTQVVTEVSLDCSTSSEIIDKLICPYDLFSGEPLYRLFLVDTSGSTYLLVDFHHLISDGSSVYVLLENVIRSYGNQELPQDLYWQNVSDIFTCGKLKESFPADGNLEYFAMAYPTDLGAGDIALAEKYWKCSFNVLAIAAAIMALAETGSKRRICVNWLYSNRGDAMLRDAFGVLVHTYGIVVDRERIPQGDDPDSIMELIAEINRQMQESILHPETDYYGLADTDFDLYPLEINNMIHLGDSCISAPFEMERQNFCYAQQEPSEGLDVEFYMEKERLVYNFVGAGNGTVGMSAPEFNNYFSSHLMKLLCIR